MDSIKNIIDLPIIVQGALGSFLFWLAYALTQKLFNSLSNIIAKFNKNLEKENILCEQTHLLQEILDVKDPRKLLIHTSKIQAALYKLIQGIIFICFGLITSELIDGVSIVAYIIAIYFLFRALKIGYIQLFEDSIDKSIKKKRFDELAKRLEELKSE